MLSQRRMMSNLSKLAKSMKPSTMLDRNKFSKEFRERYPVIQENFLDVTGKENYHQADSALNFTMNDRLESQIRKIGDQQFIWLELLKVIKRSILEKIIINIIIVLNYQN